MNSSDIADPLESSTAGRILLKRLLVSACLVVLTTTGLIIPFPLDGRLWSAIFDLAHAPVFCGLVLAIAGLLDPSAVGLSPRYPTLVRMASGRVLSVAGFIMALGLTCEYLQRYAGRSSDLHDVVANSVGIFVALLWLYSVQRTASRSSRFLFRMTALTALIGVSVAPALVIWESVQQLWTFPQIASFERRWEVGAWQTRGATAEATAEWSTHGQMAMKVKLNLGSYPGVTFHFLRTDWRSFSRLQLDLKNPGEAPIRLALRLNDQLHIDNGFPSDDRFGQTIEIPPASQLGISIDLETVAAAPAERRMQLGEMAMLCIHATEPEEPLVFMVDHIRLASSASAK